MPEPPWSNWGFQPTDESPGYYEFVDNTVPAMRGTWNGGSTGGILEGFGGFFNILFPRLTQGFLEFPRTLGRERLWFQYVRENATCAGYSLWITNFRTAPTRLDFRYVTAQEMLVKDNFGGSGVAAYQSEDLFNNPLSATETGLTVR